MEWETIANYYFALLLAFNVLFLTHVIKINRKPQTVLYYKINLTEISFKLSY
ncbi:hypothetical protein BDD43_1317 [Mucilaginibacter gracilis]|uniref:Uncharacterized protein n=1 Tax=Mucilaginibacter gracilis TaxID=423350 RepID=A0A495IXE8_9SPHI|nr:hypothetical protein BDD43_1317 [Mucilaginibacter gracilis]